MVESVSLFTCVVTSLQTDYQVLAQVLLECTSYILKRYGCSQQEACVMNKRVNRNDNMD
jgi:hypothetical protein